MERNDLSEQTDVDAGQVTSGSEGATVRPPGRSATRRADLVLAAVAALVSGLAAFYLISQVRSDREVLVFQRTVQAGAVVDQDDLGVAEVPASSPLRTVSPDDRDQFIGRRALTEIPAGSIAGASLLRPGPIVPSDFVQVGFTTDLGEGPTIDDMSGKIVDVYAVDDDGPAQRLVSGVLVVEEERPTESTRYLSMLVPDEVSASLLAAAHNGRIAVSLKAGVDS